MSMSARYPDTALALQRRRWRPLARLREAPTLHGWLLPLGLGCLLALLTLVPLIAMLAGSLRPTGLPLSSGWTLDHYSRVWTSGWTYAALLRSFLFAACSTAFAILVAALLAWLLERSDISGRDLFRAAILMPMVTPPLLLAIGWVLLMSSRIGIIPQTAQALFGPAAGLLDIYSLGGMIFVQGLAMVPSAFLLLAPAMRNLDACLEEAARMSGANALQTLGRVTLPLLLPPFLSASTLLLIAAMLSFDIPAIIGLPAKEVLLSLEVFRMMQPPSGMPAYGEVAALNSSLFVLMAIAMGIYYRATHQSERFATITGKGYRPTRVPLGRWRPLGLAFVCGYFAVAVVLPFCALLWFSLVPYFSGFDVAMLDKLSFESFVYIFTTDRVMNSVRNSVLVATAASVGAVVLAFLVAWVVVRSRVTGRQTLDMLAMLPVGIPHIMMGVALVFIFFGFRAIPIYGTVWIIALGHAIVYLPFSNRTLQGVMIQINKELEEAAMVSGASFVPTLRRVVLPLLLPAAIGVFIWVAVHSLREFSISAMLQSGRNEVLSTVLYSYWNSGKGQYAAAIAVCLMATLGVLVALMGRVMQRRHGD